MPARTSQGIGESQMIVTTLDGIAGRITQETVGVVRGTQLWTRRVVKSSVGGIRHMRVTGVADLDQGLAEAKQQAHKAMVDQAAAMGADSVIGVRIDVLEMSNGVFCVNTTGTAVRTIALPLAVSGHEMAMPPLETGIGLDMSVLMARPSCEGSTLRH
jgi:uncharacterized protein YbjQ (UPF0145 family)